MAQETTDDCESMTLPIYEQVLTSSQIEEVNRILSIISGARMFIFNDTTYSFCDINDGNATYFMSYIGQEPMMATYIKL